MCWEINPFRFSFWGSKTACASGGGQFLFLLGLFLDTPVVFVFWSRLRRVTFQRWKVTKDRRACGPGPGVGGRRNRHGACKSFGCYPPFKSPPSILRPLAPRADIPLAKLVSSCPAFGCTHAAFRTTNPYKIALGLSRLDVVSLLSDLRDYEAICEKQTVTGFSLHRLNPKAIL